MICNGQIKQFRYCCCYSKPCCFIVHCSLWECNLNSVCICVKWGSEDRTLACRFCRKKMLMLSDVPQKYISCNLSLGARKVTHVSASLINSKISVQVSETNDSNRCSIHVVVLWIITLCTLLGGHQLYRTHCLHLQGRSKDRGRIFVHNVSNPLSDHMLYPRRQWSDISLL